MALSRYVLTANVTIPAGTAATVVAGEPGTGGAAGYGDASVAGASLGSEGDAIWNEPTSLLEGTVIELDPAGNLYAIIGGGNLRAFVDGQDDVGHAGLSN